MIVALRKDHPGSPYSTSGGGARADTWRGMPSPALVEAAIKAIRTMPAWQANPKPIVINEDLPAVPHLDAAWRNYCSWGYHDQGFEG